MESKAVASGVRMSPRKVRLVANEVRGYEFTEAVDVLTYMPKKAARTILKLARSAAANAKILNPEVLEKELYIKKVYVDAGQTLKRFMPRARGKADRILKRTSVVTLVLSDE